MWRWCPTASPRARSWRRWGDNGPVSTEWEGERRCHNHHDGANQALRFRVRPPAHGLRTAKRGFQRSTKSLSHHRFGVFLGPILGVFDPFPEADPLFSQHDGLFSQITAIIVARSPPTALDPLSLARGRLPDRPDRRPGRREGHYGSRGRFVSLYI